MGILWSSLSTEQAIAGNFSIVCNRGVDLILNSIKSMFLKVLCSRLEILAESNVKTHFAVLQDIELLVNFDKLTKVQDSYDKPIFKLEYGTYYVKPHNMEGGFFADYNSNGILLYAIHQLQYLPLQVKSRSAELKKYVTDLYEQYCAPSEMVLIVLNENDRWSRSIHRKPSQFRDQYLTKAMKEAISTIEIFRNSSDVYLQQGTPYRYGMMLWGVAGSGKTAVIEILARRYNMTIYNLNINTPSITNSVLAGLIADIPSNSLLVIEEFDKQVDTLQKGSDRNLDIGGLLSALDGPQRLSSGVVVIMTANRFNFLSASNRKSMFRRGRIDKVIEFNELLNIELNISSSS
jgi:hypothetical protein